MTGVEIEMTSQRQTLSGVVTDARGAPVKDYLVVVFAQDPARRTAALDRADQMELQDPDLLEGLSRQASSFTIRPADTQTLDLKLFTLQ